MRKRLFAAALLLGTALSSAADARSLIVAIPANMAPATQEAAEGFFANVFNRLQPGDMLTVIDATHLTLVAQPTAPADLGPDPKARARVFGAAQGRINDVIEQPDPAALPDNLNIPVLLRELGVNVLPKLPDHAPQIILLGSLIWESKDANWSFRDALPSDGFLVKPVGVFGITGQETILAGSLVSICYTDAIDGFLWEGFRQSTIAFWGKSIVGRGGKVGGIQPMDDACAARLFSPAEDKTAYVINRKEAVYLRKMHWIKIDVR
jgi:hypothetical protein